MVFFESPHRTAATVRAMVEAFGAQRRAAVCRELTKTHEEVVRGTLGELAAWAGERDVLGEVTVVLGGAVVTAPEPEELADEVLGLVAGGQRLKDAARRVATERGVSTKALYEAALRARS
jgi:16S rRNA (cytidine1402-2'-O)-methyltransferase